MIYNMTFENLGRTVAVGSLKILARQPLGKSDAIMGEPQKPIYPILVVDVILYSLFARHFSEYPESQPLRADSDKGFQF